jgi:hypothetical protein
MPDINGLDAVAGFGFKGYCHLREGTDAETAESENQQPGCQLFHSLFLWLLLMDSVKSYLLLHKIPPSSKRLTGIIVLINGGLKQKFINLDLVTWAKSRSAAH